jgi:hypothetical protein
MMPESLTRQVSAQVKRALDFALTNIGVCEDPLGSNRGPEIDAWAREFDSPVGSFWCALAVAKARREGGLWVPEHDAGSCDEWWYGAQRAGYAAQVPSPGAAVVYTNGRGIVGGRYDGQPDAVHIGIVLRLTPALLSIEGNTTLGKYDKDGFVQALKEVNQACVLGYVRPEVVR